MPSGDAELLELGRKFEAALAQSREASEKYDAICERVHLRADAKACRSKDTAAYLKAWEKAWDAEGQPARDAEKASNDADWRLDGLYQKTSGSHSDHACRRRSSCSCDDVHGTALVGYAAC
jgi:hypothetical protein